MVLVGKSQSAPPRHVVELTGVTKVHPGGVRALDGVTVGFGRGSFTAVMGPSGSGKSTLLLKDRVTALDEFLDAIDRVAAGGTAMDPEVVRQLFVRNDGDSGIGAMTAREREVLGLVAQGLSNSAICAALVLAPASVEKHISNILTKLDLPPADDTHRRVRAVLAYLNQ